MLSQLAGGGQLMDWQKSLLNNGYVNVGQGVNSNTSVQNVEGTPVVTQPATTPATTPAQPKMPTAPTVYSAPAQPVAPTPYNPYGNFALNTNLTGYQNNRTGIPYRPTGA